MIVSLLACSPTFSDLYQPSENAQYLLFITHGRGASIDDWPLELAAEMEAKIIEPQRWDIWVYDWSEDAANKLTASGSGVEHGEYISQHLIDSSYEHYHLVGHSVGAFIVHTLEKNHKI